MREYRYTVTEHDPTRPWIIRSTERRSVELEDAADFFAWAHREWPSERFTVQLDPWQLTSQER